MRYEEDETSYAILLFTMEWRSIVAVEDLSEESTAEINDIFRPRRVLKIDAWCTRTTLEIKKRSALLWNLTSRMPSVISSAGT